MYPDYKRNNKVALRNFSEGVDFHDVVKVLLCRLLRRKHSDSTKCLIYTEYNSEEPNDSYPDIEVQIKLSKYVYELQEEVSEAWKDKMLLQYGHTDLIIVELKKVRHLWKERVANGADPMESLKYILQDYII